MLKGVLLYAKCCSKHLGCVAVKADKLPPLTSFRFQCGLQENTQANTYIHGKKEFHIEIRAVRKIK